MGDEESSVLAMLNLKDALPKMATPFIDMIIYLLSE